MSGRKLTPKNKCLVNGIFYLLWAAAWAWVYIRNGQWADIGNHLSSLLLPTGFFAISAGWWYRFFVYDLHNKD